MGKISKVIGSFGNSTSTPATVVPTLYYAYVIDNEDPKGMNRIKVNIPSFDNDKDISSIPYCFPAMPSYLHMIPPVGSAVIILLKNPWNPAGGRYYIGPVWGSDLDQGYEEALDDLGIKHPKVGE